MQRPGRIVVKVNMSGAAGLSLQATKAMPRVKLSHSRLWTESFAPLRESGESSMASEPAGVVGLMTPVTL
jgi:hypothetical protein